MRQERLYRTEGIVLREMDYAEADRILTVLSPLGKRSLIAKGIRRPTSRKVGHLGLFYRAQMLVAKGANLDIVTQAESLEEFEGLRSDLMRFTYACYVGELAERLAQEDEENPPLYELTMHTLRRLAAEPDPRLWVRYFELRLLSISGYQPELFECLSCHEPIRPAPNYFSAEHGGLLCTRCGANVPRAISVSVNAQKVLRYLQRHEPAEIESLRLAQATHNEVEMVLLRYLEYTLERELKSVSFLHRLRHELREAGQDQSA